MSSTATSIEWTDATWNPLRGCSRVSEGCRNCYAEAVAARFCGPGQPYHGLAERTPSGPRWTGEVRLIEDALTLPLRWRKPRRIFVNSMSDLFHEDVPDEWIDRVFAVMALAPQHVFQVLTKRAERMRAYFSARGVNDRVGQAINRLYDSQPRGEHPGWYFDQDEPWRHLPNVWLGVSVEDQQAADARIPALLLTPSAVRFISAEPLLGPVTLGPRRDAIDVLRSGLDWVIVGGESGSGARPCDVAWVRDIVRQCREAGVACFVKQLGANVVTLPHDTSGWVAQPDGPIVNPYIRDRKGGDPSEWPEDLNVREFPEVQV